MIYDDGLYFIDDVLEAYCARRKNLPKNEIKDLLRCVIAFLKKDMKEKNHYAYQIPKLGVLYTKLETQLEGKNASTDNSLFNEILLETYLNPRAEIYKFYFYYKLIKS